MEQPITTTPKWIRELQETSWNLEFLISGGAIFTLVQASGFFAEAVESIKITAWLPGTNLFLILGVLGIQVLMLGFGLHLLLRAFWVALVCVTYLYPDGAVPERVRWRRPFRAQAPSGPYFAGLLLKLNRVCATVMFLSIISTLMLAGLIVIVVVGVSLPALLLGLLWSPWFDWYMVLMIPFLLAYLVDMVAFGALRRVPGLAWVLFPTFWLFDRLSLRVVLQPALWLFASHVPRGRMLGMLSAFMMLALTYSYTVIYRDMRWPNIFDRRAYREHLAPGPLLLQGVYRDEADGRLTRVASIASKYADKPFLEVFLIYRKEYELDMARTPSAHYLSDLALITIDDSLYQHVDWYPTRKYGNDQLGITAMVPIGQLRMGAHQLFISSRGDTSRPRQVIPFWKTE